MTRRDRTIEVLHAQEQNEDLLLALPNVIGVGTGFRQRAGEITDEVVVQVFVSRKTAEGIVPQGGLVPPGVNGLERSVPTDVIELPIVEAQQDTTRYRPVQGGCSIGPEASVSAGTLGGWVCDNTDNTIVLLTNNHVISNLDTQPALRRVVQPGRLDGGTLPADLIGQLKRDVALTTTPNPPPGAPPAVTAVDAAIGTITVGRDDDVLQIAPAIYEVQGPALNMNVQKRGRTTRRTTNGRITTVGATINITYRNRTRLGRIANAFIISSTDGNVFSAAGDSGSLIVNQAEGQLSGTLPVVGLLFAGGTDASNRPITIANDINAVFGALNLSTVCTCVARALIEGAMSAGREAEVSDRSLRKKETQLRKLQDEVLRQAPGGKELAELISREAPRLSAALLRDDDLFGMAVRAIAPWVRHPNNFELLEAELDPATVAAVGKIADRASRLQPDLKAGLTAVKEMAAGAEGKKVRQVLGRVEKPPRPRKGGRSASRRTT